MDNFSENIIGGIITTIPIILLIVKLFATEYVANFTKELFNSKTKKKANLIFNGIVVFLLIIGASIIFLPYLSKENLNQTTDDQEQQVVTPPKTEAEVYLEAVKLALDKVEAVINNSKERNIKIIANRGKRLVYQIGDIKNNEEAVLNLYKNIKSIPMVDISRIFVFEIKRNKFFLYKDDGYTEEQITDSLVSIKNRIAMVEPKVEILDLLQYCKAKESVTNTKPLKFRKDKIEISCCNCDK